MTASAPGSTSTTAGSSAQRGQLTERLAVAADRDRAGGVGAELDPLAGEHGDLGQVDVAAVVDLGSARIRASLEAASMTTTSSTPSATSAAGAIFMPEP